jgi:hypothetical protein
MLFSCEKLELVLAEKVEVYTVIFDIFEKTNNFEIKEAALWTLNTLVKDEDLRKRLKEKSKMGWLILESKQCGWLCYPQFVNRFKFEMNPLGHIPNLLPDKLSTYHVVQTARPIRQFWRCWSFRPRPKKKSISPISRKRKWLSFSTPPTTEAKPGTPSCWRRL